VKERHVLSSTINSRDAYDAVADHVGAGDLSEQGFIIWKGIQTYYDTDPDATRIDVSLLADRVARRLSADKHKEIFRGLVNDLASFESSPPNVVADLLATKREVKGHQLASALLNGSDTAGLLHEYGTLLGQTSLGEEETPETRQGYSIEELVAEKFSEKGLIEVWPPSLNERLDGGVKRGHHLVVFARPEMGKTLLVIEMMAGFVSQGFTVLYVGNEDPIDDINMRIVNRLSGMTKTEVREHPARAAERAGEHGYNLLIIASLTPGTPREITNLILDHAPDVLVLDQLRNINMYNDNYVLQLEKAATQARTWAKKYSCVVVSVTQAGDSATGKAVLDIGDVDYSNTGIPGQADVMIGLGANQRNIDRGELVISLPKNKVSGRHEYFAVLAEPTLSQLIPLE